MSASNVERDGLAEILAQETPGEVAQISLKLDSMGCEETVILSGY